MPLEKFNARKLTIVRNQFQERIWLAIMPPRRTRNVPLSDVCLVFCASGDIRNQQVTMP